jgi:putative endonuclease
VSGISFDSSFPLCFRVELFIREIESVSGSKNDQKPKSRRKSLGDAGERLAATELTKLGYRSIISNWRHGRKGEIDLIAWHGDTLVFVEVRTRFGTDFITPEESVDYKKQARLLALAEAYLQTHPECYLPNGDYPPCRIDVVAIQFTHAGKLERLTVHENAVYG